MNIITNMISSRALVCSNSKNLNIDRFFLRNLQNYLFRFRFNELELYCFNGPECSDSGSDDYHLLETDSPEQISQDVQQKDLMDTENIWSWKGKPSERNTEATAMLLKIRGSESFKNRFNDKKTVKKKLWNEIAEDMQKAGFLVTAEKCQQKYLNLVKQYSNFVSTMKKTGQDRRIPPTFYKELHEILGEKDKFTLSNVSDSLLISEDHVSPIDETPNEQSQPVEIEKQLEMKENVTCKKSLKPYTVTKADILKTIVNANNNLVENQNKSFAKLFSLMEGQNKIFQEQNQQRNKLIEIFEKSINPKKLKRKRRKYEDKKSDSSSESS